MAKHLPEFAQNGKQDVTVRQLLTHQGGLTPDNALHDYDDGPEKAWQRIWALPLTAEPGSRFIYCDVGFIVLGELVASRLRQRPSTSSAGSTSSARWA